MLHQIVNLTYLLWNICGRIALAWSLEALAQDMLWSYHQDYHYVKEVGLDTLLI